MKRRKRSGGTHEQAVNETGLLKPFYGGKERKKEKKHKRRIARVVDLSVWGYYSYDLHIDG